MKIYLVRHGQTEWNNLEKIQGRIDNALNEEGEKQSVKAGKIFAKIPFTKAISSPAKRALKTCELILNQHADNVVKQFKIETMDNLIEREFGILEGQSHQAYYEVETTGILPESVETRNEVFQRVNKAMEMIVKNSTDQDVILITTHSHAIRSWMEVISPVDFPFSTRLQNTQAVLLTYCNGVFQYDGLSESQGRKSVL